MNLHNANLNHPVSYQYPARYSGRAIPSAQTVHPVIIRQPEFSDFTTTPIVDEQRSYKMEQLQSEEELANLQKLSNEYTADVEGPLVGKRQSTQAITTEYANADPAFVRKTSVLPQKYSHYRTVKGDGSCGWRAIAFSYFETLVRLQDKERIQIEEARLKSLDNLLRSVGWEEHAYEGFVEETILLLKSIAASIPVTDGGAALLNSFNDPNISNAIITHFRLITSAWMKTHAEAYQPFVVDQTVEQYCQSEIEPFQVEIEHLGMNVLIDALIKPAGLAVEILYLDRAAGEEVNSHRFEPDLAPGAPAYGDAPTVRLLYRPGHYDILYKSEDIPSTHVFLADTFEEPYARIQSTRRPSAIGGILPWAADIPGFSFANLPSTNLPASTICRNPHMQDEYMTSPTSPMTQGYPSPSLPLSPVPSETAGGSFRPSKYEYDVQNSAQNLPFQTATFRNSHYNPAHFRNSDFQPEIWRPDSEYAIPNKEENGRHRPSQ
ncbi:MAG: hypothetical protein M1812_005570 [Candelaria pacifica]|nr:MAG: hypothetical protein M1812_005570 [Candelaria pacifica]